MPVTPLHPDAVRRNLVALAKQHGRSLAYLSRVAGMPTGYLGRFVRVGSPRTLPEEVRLLIAMELDVDERLIGGRDPWLPALTDSANEQDVECETRSFPSPLVLGLSRMVD